MNRSWFHLPVQAPRESRDILVLSLQKGREWYCFMYDDAHRKDVVRTIGMQARNPELSLSFEDACNLYARIRSMETIMTAQKFYRLVLWMRESQRKYDRDPSKANRTIKDQAEKVVDKEWPNQIAFKATAEFAAKVRDLRDAQDRYWRTYDEETKAIARACAVLIDRDLEQLIL